MVKVSVLASSSSGNSTLVATESTRLLVDAGLSRKETFERLTASGIRPDSLTEHNSKPGRDTAYLQCGNVGCDAFTDFGGK